MIRKIKIKKKYKNDDFRDLIGVSLIALISLLFYDGEKAANQAGETIIFLLFILLITIVIISAAVANIRSRRSRLELREKIKFGAIQSMNLNWGQALKHDLLIYFIPAFILVLPAITKQTTSFNDLLQAAVAFFGLAYLKIIYWGKLFSF